MTLSWYSPAFPGDAKPSKVEHDPEPDDAGGEYDGNGAVQQAVKAEFAPHEEPSAVDTLEQGASFPVVMAQP